MSDRVIYSVGHSTRSADELTAVLRDGRVTRLADVRRYPASRRHPQHNRGALEQTLPAQGIAYVWLGETLGGRAKQAIPTDQSRNNGWQVAAFRYYADAMPTAAFQTALAELEALAREQPTAIMCAERLWWQCHRRLLADILVVRGWTVAHLLDVGKRQEHKLTEFARVEDGVLTYPALV
jgi:uncharacterized protein (DUF488 family)